MRNRFVAASQANQQPNNLAVDSLIWVIDSCFITITANRLKRQLDTLLANHKEVNLLRQMTVASLSPQKSHQ